MCDVLSVSKNKHISEVIDTTVQHIFYYIVPNNTKYFKEILKDL